MNSNMDNNMQDTQLDGMYRMASKFLGYTGPKTREALEQFKQSSPAVAAKMKSYGNAMARGGLMMRKAYQEGGLEDGSADTSSDATTATTDTDTGTGFTTSDLMKGVQETIMSNLSSAGTSVPSVSIGGVSGVSESAGSVGSGPSVGGAGSATAETVEAVEPFDVATVEAKTVSPEVQAELDKLKAVTGTVSDQALVTAVTQDSTAVSNLQAKQGEAILMENPVQRELEAGEIVDPVADAVKAAKYTEQIEAATAEPSKKTSVAYQLEQLMQDFEGKRPPSWAAGAMRQANALLVQRGLGASSISGQAVVQAAMESALPIAMADAQTAMQFEMQNLSNRQQRAMLAAQQRAQFIGQEFDQAFQARVANAAKVSDIANLNFTAEQQVALENSRAVNTMNLQNLNNRQAMVMAEAAALSNLEIANLNNRQQAAVQNAQNFLQMDLANMENEQQTVMFKAQQNVQALFNDQAAENAAAQFNAANENQVNQFFAQLETQTRQFNASQVNAMNQFNIDQANSIAMFNAEVAAQRDIAEARNKTTIAQANAQLRATIATTNAQMANQRAMLEAQNRNNITMATLDNVWQRERDIMAYSIQTANNNADRATQIAIQKLKNDATLSVADAERSAANASSIGELFSDVIDLF